MKPHLYRTLSVSMTLVISLFFGCRKETNNGGFNYNFENLSDKAINIDIYQSLDDYNNGTNVYIHGRAAVRGYFAVPLDKFTKGQTYYADWYSDDYLYTNWYWTNVTLRNKIEPTYTDYEYIINVNQFADPSRAFWMNGIDVKSAWKLTNAYTASGNNYISVWPQLTGDQRNVLITLYKNFSANIQYTDPATHTVKDTTLAYRANYDTNQNISTATIYYPDNSTYAILKSNFSPTNYTFSGDKSNVLATFHGQQYYYQLTRQ